MAHRLRLALFAAALLITPAGIAAADPLAVPPPLNFIVKRDGNPIGTHRLSFRSEKTPDGERLIVDIAIDIKVKVAFVTIYTYRFSGRETWAGGRLVGLETETDDNGSKLGVRARPVADGLQVEGAEAHYTAPASMLTDSYWRQEMVKQQRFIDIENGGQITLVSELAGRRRVSVGGRMVDCDIYKLSGELDGELGYTPDGEWALLRFKSHGSDILYVRAP